MPAQKSRIDKAREAYLKGDRNLAKKVHQKKAIHRSAVHKEMHKTSFNLPQIILGGQDGMVNVLGVILGVAAATLSSKIVIVAGLAATFAESVSMAAVAYTSKITEADYYQSEYEREKWEVENLPKGEKEEIRILYKGYGFTGQELENIVEKITANKNTWINIMMNQELKLEPVERKEALSNALIVGLSALIGSFIPLLVFFFLPIKIAMFFSLLISSAALFAVGSYKAYTTLGRNVLKQGIEMTVIGMLSALTGYLIGSLFKI